MMAEGVIELTVSGSITEDDYEQAIPVFEAALERHDRIRVFADLKDMEGFTAAGLKEDIRYSMSRLGDINRFERIAVLADSTLLRGWAQVGGVLAPGVDMEVFEPGERSDALTWLNEASATS